MRCPSSNVVYALLLVCFVAAVLLEDATDGRSLGLIAVAGLVTIWAGVCSVLGRDTLVEDDAPGESRALDARFYRGTQGVGGVIVGAAFVVIGVLAATGTIDIR